MSIFYDNTSAAAHDDTRYRLKFIIEGWEYNSCCFTDINEYSREYLTEVSRAPGMILQNSSLFNADFCSKYVNIINGMRVTPNAPENYVNTIYMLGDSTMFGSLCADDGTTAAFLQRLCNTNAAGRYRVANYAVKGMHIYLNVLQLSRIPLKENDIVILMCLHRDDNDFKVIKNLHTICQEQGAHFCFFLPPYVYGLHNPSEREMVLQSNNYQTLYKAVTGEISNIPVNSYRHPYARYLPDPLMDLLISAGCPCVDLLPYFNRPHPMGEVFIDKIHKNQRGNATIAQVIYSNFISRIDQIAVNRQEVTDYCAKYYYGAAQILLQKEEGLQNWLREVRNNAFINKDNVGAIVMNCNPFTLGHLHLIESALQQVDSLYLFILQEDLSEFKLNDRMEMLRQGVAPWGDRVKVFAGGNYIISTHTFPEYFEKAEFADQKVDSDMDLVIFGSSIAPALNIKRRFVGEEPYCNITRQYNETMKQFLPVMGIKVVEIPRLSQDNVAISASLVRQHLQNGQWEQVRKLVPHTTHDYLRKHFRK